MWHADKGWGVIDSEDTPGGCWAHYSSVLVPDYRALEAGQPVTLEVERAEQDGYSFRAVEVWPTGQEPHRTEADTTGASGAHESTRTITFDHPETPSTT